MNINKRGGMGYYIDRTSKGPFKGRNKVMELVQSGDAEIITQPKNLGELPAGKALICVVDNGLLQAAGYCFSEIERSEFGNPTDERPKTWLLMDKAFVERVSGYAEDAAQRKAYAEYRAEIKAEQARA